MIFARLTKKQFLATSVAIIAWSGAAYGADFTIENVRLQPPGKNTIVAIKSIDVRGSNLSREEFARLYDLASPKEDVLALSKRLQAESISLPEIVVTRDDNKPGAINFRGYQITKINQGRFARFAVASMDGKFRPDDSDGDVTLKSGALVIEDGDFAKIIDAALAGNMADASTRIGKIEFKDFEIRFPEKGGSGSLIHTVRLGLLAGSANYAGEVPLKSQFEVKGIQYIPATQSSAALGMAEFGYKQIDAGFRGEGTYNPSSKAYDLSDFTLSGINAGVLTLKGLFGSVGPDAFTGTQIAQLGALMAADISNVSLRYADNGLFEKGLVFYAKMNGKDAMAVRQEWAGMVAGILPMVMGGDPGGLRLAGAVSEFIKTPKSLEISVKGKNGPVRISDLQQVSDPSELIKRIELNATANK